MLATSIGAGVAPAFAEAREDGLHQVRGLASHRVLVQFDELRFT